MSKKVTWDDGIVEVDRYTRLTDLIKDHVPPHVLADVLKELDRFDTEAKREIIRYQRAMEEK